MPGGSEVTILFLVIINCKLTSTEGLSTSANRGRILNANNKQLQLKKGMPQNRYESVVVNFQRALYQGITAASGFRHIRQKYYFNHPNATLFRWCLR
jgi:hypothetical protein